VTGARLLPIVPVLITLLMSRTAAGAALTPDEEKESYQIYSTLLEENNPRAEEWAIVQHTKAFEMCTRPAKEQESVYGPLFDDYALKNKQGLALEPHFKLPAYTMVSPEESARSTRSRSFAIFSAVGFNADRTRAAVCFWAGSGGTCQVLTKKDDIWQKDKNWRGGGCFWAA
jgi:hypothetical protein